MATAAALLTAALSLNASYTPLNLSALVEQGIDVRGPSAVVLPGMPATSYAGFFEVNATDHASLFGWYYPALNGNASAPLLVWLQGGPGSSSLFGLFAEMGPYAISAAGAPVANPYTWATENAMVFIDNPRGTGFSFTDPGTLCTTWECYAADMDSWLRQFVDAFGFVGVLCDASELWRLARGALHSHASLAHPSLFIAASGTRPSTSRARGAWGRPTRLWRCLRRSTRF